MNHRLQLAVSKAFHKVRETERIDELLSGAITAPSNLEA